MHKIFVEGDNIQDKADKHFIEIYLTHLFQDRWRTKLTVVGIGGYTELYKSKVEFEKTEAGYKNYVIFDADISSKGGGFISRKKTLEEKGKELKIDFEIFLFPNNNSDGDIEFLFEQIINSDHKCLLDCFSGYESCVSQHKNAEGGLLYALPLRKSRIYAYIDAFPKSRREKEFVKDKNYFFDIPKYWDFENPYLEPLKSFLTAIVQ